MTVPTSPIDSVLLFPEPAAALTRWPAAAFPPYTDQRLREFREHLSTLAGDNLANGLSGLSEPGLYALAAVLARAAASEPDAFGATQSAAVVPPLLTELRRRNCRGMGTDPTGPVRRGRLLQLVGAFTTLHPGSAALREPTRLAGACPFCAGDASFQVSLPTVTWQCFACARSGALLEFAESLLEPIAPA